jgi:hypothetical protein
MRYYGQISLEQTVILIAVALSFAMALNMRALATFIASEGTILGELQSQQAQAKLAAFKFYVAGAVRQEAQTINADDHN